MTSMEERKKWHVDVYNYHKNHYQRACRKKNKRNPRRKDTKGREICVFSLQEIIEYTYTNYTTNIDDNSNYTQIISVPIAKVKNPPCRWTCELTNDAGYVVYSAFGSFYIPMFVMLFFYWRIYRAAVRTTRAINQGFRTTKGKTCWFYSSYNICIILSLFRYKYKIIFPFPVLEVVGCMIFCYIFEKSKIYLAVTRCEFYHSLCLSLSYTLFPRKQQTRLCALPI